MDQLSSVKYDDHSVDSPLSSPLIGIEGRAIEFVFAAPEDSYGRTTHNQESSQFEAEVQVPQTVENARITVRSRSGSSKEPKKVPAKPRAAPRQKKFNEDENIGSHGDAAPAATSAMVSTKTATMTNIGQPRRARKVLAESSSTSIAGRAATGQAGTSHEIFLTCYRCNCYVKGSDAKSASKEMDKHLKECGLIVCVLCNKTYKSVQTLQIHQRKAHMP
ncbi:Hypothetical predicted protein [Cloeon dipterum]|uniref:C2H2-type domain-containing protein n=1 Tax=Cloeon dipterum TaxID=197152 RepID=A0A8S1BZH0_9INSE|nr:Hypothetical predicted protein [Cloeon dipterum]